MKTVYGCRFLSNAPFAIFDQFGPANKLVADNNTEELLRRQAGDVNATEGYNVVPLTVYDNTVEYAAAQREETLAEIRRVLGKYNVKFLKDNGVDGL